VSVELKLSGGRALVRNEHGWWTTITSMSAHPERAPGYICRLKARDGELLIDDLRAGEGWINDPRFGGIGVVGVQLARRLDRHGLGPDDAFGPAERIPTVAGQDSSWEQNNAWPVDGRTLAAVQHGFGVRSCSFSLETQGEGLVKFRVVTFIGDRWSAGLIRVTHTHTVLPQLYVLETKFELLTTPSAMAGPPLFVKEPKVGIGGVRDVREIRVGPNRSDRALPKTFQSAPQPGKPIELGRLRARVTGDGMLDGRWVERASALARFGAVDSHGDDKTWPCNDGKLRSRWELIRWNTGEAAVLLCGWQGGRGPYDCEPLSVAWHGAVAEARIELTVAP
jgi:hypothetical protein